MDKTIDRKERTMRVRVYYKSGTMDCYTIVVEDRQADGDGRA